jgi:hypothetical protein
MKNTHFEDGLVFLWWEYTKLKAYSTLNKKSHLARKKKGWNELASRLDESYTVNDKKAWSTLFN